MSRPDQRLMQLVRSYLRLARDEDAVVVLGLFLGCLVISGTVAILLIDLLESLGLWRPVSGVDAATPFEHLQSRDRTNHEAA